jgi:hypothetical protein
MIIGNPIYDTYFKRLMENERTVKFFISTLLECEVLKVDLRPQEVTYVDKDDKLKLYRVDFAAIVQTENGSTEKVLIKVQKSLYATDMVRFRSENREHYQRVYADKNGPLPIIFIYLLGFNLPNIERPCFKINNRGYFDMFRREYFDERCDFTEGLTHDCYVVQAARLPEHRSTDRLCEMLSLFEQRNFTNTDKTEKLYSYEPTHEEVREMCYR